MLKTVLFVAVIASMLLNQSDAQDRDASANGLWRITAIGFCIPESNDFEPEIETRIVLILEDRFFDVQAIDSNEPYSYTFNILARDHHQGKDFCLIEYPKELSIKRGKMIINSERTDHSLLVVDFEGHDDSGKKSTVKYCLVRPTSLDSSRYFETLVKSRIYAPAQTDDNSIPATNHVLHESFGGSSTLHK